MKLPTALLFIALWVAREAIALPFEDFSLASIDGNDTTTAEQLFARDATDNYQKCGKRM